MNSTVVAALAVASVLATTVSSCGGRRSGEEISGIVEFTVRTDSAAWLMPDFYGDSVYFVTSYSFVWPETMGGQNLDVLQDSLRSLAFGSAGSSFAEASGAFLASGLEPADADTVISRVPVPIAEARDAERAGMSSVSSRVVWLSPELMVMGVDSYGYYYGAAHGYKTTRYLNYSLRTDSVLTAGNLFKRSDSETILEAVKRSALESCPESAVDTALITGYENFRLTDSDVVFVYQPYEIAPYAMGVVEIPVSVYDLFGNFTPFGHKALGLSD